MTAKKADKRKKIGSLRNKLLIWFLLLSIIPLIGLGIVTFFVSQSSLENKAFNELELLRTVKASQIENYFQTIENQVLTFSEDKMIVDAMKEFKSSFDSMQDEMGHSPAEIETIKQELLTYYVGEYSDEYRRRNNGQSPPAEIYLSQLDDKAIILQYHYIKDNPFPLGSKDGLDKSPDMSAYSEIHAKYHPIIRNYLQKFHYSDIFLIDSETGHIIYSVFKDIDYGSSLIDGPYAQTDFAKAFRETNEDGVSPNFVDLVDYQFYPPSYDDAASFIASPIFDGEKKIGVLIFQIPIDQITAIMQDRTGLGETGEAYLIGQDSLWRSNSRFLNELKIDTILSPDFVINTIATQSALLGQSDTQIIDNYRDKRVLSSWSPVTISTPDESHPQGINWAIIAEIDQAEVNAPVRYIATITASLIIFMVGFVVLVTLLVSSAISSPIAVVATATVGMASGDLTRRVKVNTGDEIEQMANAFNSMADEIEGVVASLDQRTRILETVSIFNERLSAILNLEDLLAGLVNKLKDDFNYYHVHIYMLDDKQENLVMAEGTGMAGKRMKANKHNIPLSAKVSLVARAARSGKIVKVDNVREADNWLANPLLPDTYSEMAVPISLAGQVVGVLDVQENKVAALKDDDADLLLSLASQVAIAIRNAHLFAEIEVALEEARATQKRYMSQVWEKVETVGQGATYQYHRSNVELLNEKITAQFEKEAIAQNQPVVVKLNGHNEDKEQTALVSPIQLQKQVIGTIQLHKTNISESHKWSEHEVALVQIVAEQIAQNAENIRLFAETRELASREQVIREITDKMRTAPNLDALLEITARELSQRFGVPHTVMEMGIEAKVQSDE